MCAVFSKFKWLVDSPVALNKMLRVSEEQADQIWNNQTLRGKILDSGIFSKFKVKSFSELPPPLRADILSLFEDAEHGTHILQKFNDNFDDFVAVYKKAKSQIDGLENIAKKRAFFEDLAADESGNLINAIRGVLTKIMPPYCPTRILLPVLSIRPFTTS